MTCQEVRQDLFAFLDDELDSSLSITIQRHLESCHTCGREAEIERMIGKGLSHGLDTQAGAASYRFDESTLAKQLGIGAPGSRRYVPLAAPRHWMQSWTRHLYAVGQAMVILAGLAAGVRFSAGRGRRPTLADLLPANPKPIAQGGEPVQIASADPASVASWIREQRDWDVKISTPESDRHKLLGARTCTVSGRPAAQALYEIDGVPASLVILAADQSGILPDSKGDLAHQFRGHTVLARRHGALTYAAVGRASKEELAQLMPDAIG